SGGGAAGVKAEGTGRGVVTTQFFLVGVLVGSACGLVVGSALGFELRPDRIKALKKMMRRLTGQDDRPRFDLMV
ncbi:MAG TPA: hypothetical protein VHN78_16975, partial [Chloroflexota bacterium]|nr:hypothetical protein [Chloroflexota bacterium]